jgi:tetratricopeptide (TPR) repeat protein
LLEWLKSRFSHSSKKDDFLGSIHHLLVGVYSDLQNKNFGDAQRRLLDAIKRRDEIDDPVLVGYILTYLSSSWLEQGHYKEAIDFYSDYLTHYPDDAAAYHERAAAFWYSGQLKAALDDYSRAIELSPTYILALSGRGQVLAESGQYDRALKDLNLAFDYIRQNPYFGLAWAKAVRAYIRNGRGAALAGLGSFEESFTEFDNSIAACPNNAWVYFNRARVYDSRGEREKAISDYRLSLTKNQPSLCLYRKEQAELRLRDLLETSKPNY